MSVLYELGVYEWGEKMIGTPMISSRQPKENPIIDALFEWIATELEKKVGVRDDCYIGWNKKFI